MSGRNFNDGFRRHKRLVATNSGWHKICPRQIESRSRVCKIGAKMKKNFTALRKKFQAKNKISPLKMHGQRRRIFCNLSRSRLRSPQRVFGFGSSMEFEMTSRSKTQFGLHSTSKACEQKENLKALMNGDCMFQLFSWRSFSTFKKLLL